MKKILSLILGLVLACGLQAQVANTGHAASVGSTAPDAGGDVVGPASSTNNAFARFSGTTGKLLQDSPDLTYSSPTMSVPDLFNVSSAGSIGLTAGGAAKNIALLPSTTGSVVASFNAASVTPFAQGIQIIGKDSVQAVVGIDVFAQNARYIGRRADGTAASPAALASGVTIAQFGARGYGSTAYGGATTGFNFITSQAWTDANQGTRGTVTFTYPNSASTSTALEFGNGRVLWLGANTGTTSTWPAWGVNGVLTATAATTFTDSTSSGTVATAVANSFAVPTFAASSATTFTNAANLYIAGDVANGTNVTLTNSYGLWNVGKTRLDGALRLGSSSGTTLTDTAGAFTLVGGAGNMTITAGTGASRTLTLQGTTSGSAAQTFLTGTDTGMSMPSTATAGLQIYNTSDQTTNYERLEGLWSGNVAFVRTTSSGTGTARTLSVGATHAAASFLGVASASGGVQFTTNSTSLASAGGIRFNYTSTGTSGSMRALEILPTYNQASGTAANTDLLINRTETAVGSGAQLLLDAQVGGTSKWKVSNTGTVTQVGPLIEVPSALTYASPTSVDVTLASVYTVTTVNATGSVTFNATAGGTAGQQMTILITNDATSAKTITFGTNFLSTGTLTASAASRHTSITFTSDGTNWFETGRAVMTN